MSILRHIYRNNKLVHIPSKRYSRKYNPEYLKEKASKGVSTKLGIGDFDGDGDIDGTYPKQRAGVSEKPGLLVKPNLPPLRGPRFYDRVPIVSPHEGPVSLNAWRLPSTGPLSLNTTIIKPALGPVITRTVISPDAGPNTLSSQIIAPALGPSSASVGVLPVGGPTNLNATSLKQYAVIAIWEDTFAYAPGVYNYGCATFHPIDYDPEIILIAQTRNAQRVTHIIAWEVGTKPFVYWPSRNWNVAQYTNKDPSFYQVSGCSSGQCYHSWKESKFQWNDPFDGIDFGNTWGGAVRKTVPSNVGFELNTINIPTAKMATQAQIDTAIARASAGETRTNYILSGVPNEEVRLHFDTHTESTIYASNQKYTAWGATTVCTPVPSIAPRVGPSLMSAT